MPPADLSPPPTPRRRANRPRRLRRSLVTLAALVTLASGAARFVVGPASENAPTWFPRDPRLRDGSLYFYRATDRARAPRAIVILFGNDLGFWRPARALAAALSDARFDVVGVDFRPMLAALPSGPSRDSLCAVRLDSIVGAARHALGDDALPVVLAGHSLGAELALWAGAHAPPPRLAGVLAMAPGSRSHLRVSASDLANAAEPREPGSFAVADEAAELPAGVRLAVVRGSHDSYAFADSLILARGGVRAERWVVPFAGHSLKRLVVARPLVARALDWLLEPRAQYDWTRVPATAMLRVPSPLAFHHIFPGTP